MLKMDGNIDNNYENLTKNQILDKYIENINKLRNLAILNGLSEVEFNNYMLTQLSSNERIFKKVLSKINFIICFLMLCCCLFFYKHEADSLFLRNIQTLIYPGMKFWRQLTLPIITRYPVLNKYYDESCLIINPLFKVENLNCLPCSDAYNVIDMTNFQQDINDNTPFIFKSNLRTTNLLHFFTLYKENESMFKEDAYKVESTNTNTRNLDDLIGDFVNKTDQTESHNLWKCNRMRPARALRTIFPKPSRIPLNGISLERFLAIDTPLASPYRIPDSECPNVFILQATGVRIIVLRPTPECSSTCRTLSIRLPTSYVLIYNWWYWKPISLPDKSSLSQSLSYIGSYC